ncbi:MAG: DUF2764 family protein [Kiritimatiellae bacterium]|jgi:hypothetical protein|nr:DUF2764 family protein [Kiritimatiellia bacterium]
MSLIYLISSLPALNFEAAPPLSRKDFLQSCRDWLNVKECAAVEALLFEKPSEHPFVVAWLDKETILRNALVQIRARSVDKDPSLYTRYAHGCDKKIESDVEDAIQHHNPLQIERSIDKIRWETVEELQGCDPLNIKSIFAYAVKLAIVTRWSERSSETGMETFGKLSEVSITL